MPGNQLAAPSFPQQCACSRLLHSASKPVRVPLEKAMVLKLFFFFNLTSESLIKGAVQSSQLITPYHLLPQHLCEDQQIIDRCYCSSHKLSAKGAEAEDLFFEGFGKFNSHLGLGSRRAVLQLYGRIKSLLRWLQKTRKGLLADRCIMSHNSIKIRTRNDGNDALQPIARSLIAR